MLRTYNFRCWILFIVGLEISVKWEYICFIFMMCYIIQSTRWQHSVSGNRLLHISSSNLKKQFRKRQTFPVSASFIFNPFQTFSHEPKNQGSPGNGDRAGLGGYPQHPPRKETIGVLVYILWFFICKVRKSQSADPLDSPFQGRKVICKKWHRVIE